MIHFASLRRVALIGLSLGFVACGNPSPAIAPSVGSAPSTIPVTAMNPTVAPLNPDQQFAFELVPQIGHGNGVQGIAFSPNGKVAVTASADQSARVWDTESGILLRVLPVGDQAYDVSILDDGERALVISHQSLKLYDLLRGKLLAQNTNGYLKTVILHGSEQMIRSHANGTLSLWNLNPPKLIRTLETDPSGGKHFVWAMDITRDNRLVAAGSLDGLIQFIDLQSGRLISKLTGHQGNVVRVAFSNDETRLTTFGADRSIREWDVKTGNSLRSFLFDGEISAAARINDNLALVGCKCNRAPSLVDLRTGRTQFVLAQWSGIKVENVESLAVSRDGRRCVSGTLSGRVLFSNLVENTPIIAHDTVRTGVYDLALSPRGDKVAVSFGGGEVDLWDGNLGARVSRIPYPTSNRGQSVVAFSPDGHRLFRTEGFGIVVQDLRSGALLHRLEPPQPYAIDSIAVSPTGKAVAIDGKLGVHVYDPDSGRLLYTAAQPGADVAKLAFTPDGSKLVSAAADRDARIYEAMSGKELVRFKGPVFPDGIGFLDSQTVLLGSDDLVGLWNAQSGNLVRQFAIPSSGGGTGLFTPDLRWLLAGDRSGTLTVYDVASGQRRQSYGAHLEKVAAIALSPDGKLVFTASFDGTVRITPIETVLSPEPNRDPRPMTWVADENDWLAYSVDGYFDASRRGGRLAAAVRGFEGFRVDQLAVRNNRPDILLSRLGLGTREALQQLADRYQQRLKRLGYREDALAQQLTNAPRASIVDVSRVGRHIKLRCQFDGNGHNLKRYFVFVNDVVVGDGEGVPLSGQKGVATVDVELSSGHNKLEVSVLNDVGVESLREVRMANVTENVQGDLYFLGFGVSRYADPRMDLKYAHKDALDLGQTLQPMAGRGYGRVYTRILTDRQVTKTAVLAARDFLAQAKLDDTVVVFVAGHGVFGKGPDASYYFVTFDTDVSRLQKTGLSFESIEDLITGIAPRKRLLLLDTCESGERDSEEEQVRVSVGNSRGLAARGIRPVVLSSGSGTATSVKWVGNQDRYIFNDLSRRSGTVVFSASHGSELSYEDDRLQNGIFTHELLRALTSPSADSDKNGRVTTDELRVYVTKAVGLRTDGLQNPTVDRDNLEAFLDFPVTLGDASRVPPTDSAQSGPPQAKTPLTQPVPLTTSAPLTKPTPAPQVRRMAPGQWRKRAQP